jgi:endonuclease/exonuclease/phosphatase family metal-dependent hydrolase
VRVVTWNLFHGRAVPGAGRSLLDEFSVALAAWPWDVALLQEVPPWWPAPLARAAGATERHALTSRNSFPAARRYVAERWPDLIKSNGGGANAILVRGAPPLERRRLTLRRLPERRVAQAVRLADGTWVANLHAQVHSERRAQADLAKAARAVTAWAASGPAGSAPPIVLGGDTNTRRPVAPGFVVAGGHDVDFVLARGLTAPARPEVLQRGPLSDHAPVVVALHRPAEAS